MWLRPWLQQNPPQNTNPSWPPTNVNNIWSRPWFQQDQPQSNTNFWQSQWWNNRTQQPPINPNWPSQSPPYNFGGFDFLSNLNPGSVVIVNPTNMQDIYWPVNSSSLAMPAARSASSEGQGFNAFKDLFQGLGNRYEKSDSMDSFSEDAREDELVPTRFLNSKPLIFLLPKDKQRRRIQEAAAGIYVKNFNVHK
ncbi:uncharacterized protein LOC115626557 [Scaptodrosophila lebanonensis]|uniref:Uncharacterized protein LOC115626557 n=1 Tax=Drosophila lebanonensis TaxID=7225 RepID=A0A6J2TMJ5_DROLE|nr:uncharacterized protein LOC115626557 [Scaptodrosophila lebanonensis]